MITPNPLALLRGKGPFDFAAIPELIPAGLPLDILFPITSGHPSNQLTIERRSNGRTLSPVRASPHRFDPATGLQYFRALLPAHGIAEVIEYLPVLSRAGQSLQALAPRTVRAGSDPMPDDDAPKEAIRASRDVIPRYDYHLDFLGAFSVQLANPPESFGPAPDGLHVTFYIASGEIRGPRINAKIRGEGGDWMLIRKDGVGVADVRITYETDDGALLLSRYYGIFDLGPTGYERALRRDYDPVPPLVLAPQFITSHPNWLWLNRLQCLAVGRVTMADLMVRFDLYAVHVGQPLSSSGLPRAVAWDTTG